MAAFPDFSNMNLKDVPGHSSQDWQKLFELQQVLVLMR